MSVSEKSTGQKIFHIILTVVLLICLIPTLWYGYLMFFGSKRVTNTTVHIGQLETAKGEKENFIKIKYNSNANKNGLESFEMQIGNFVDETRQNIYWQGLQYIANSPEDKINWYDSEYYLSLSQSEKDTFTKQYDTALVSDTLQESKKFLWRGVTVANYISPVVNEDTTSRYTYQSLDNLAYTGSTDPISKDSLLLLQTGEKLIYMSFKYDSYAKLNAGKIEAPVSYLDYACHNTIFYDIHKYYYNNFSIDYFAHELYNSVKGMEAGTKGNYVLPFGDMFTYYEADEEGKRGTEILSSDTDLVKRNLSSYYTIYVEVSADGAQTKEDSMFGMLHGTASYKVDGATGENGNYFTGRQIIDLDYSHFDKVLINGNDYAFKLREDVLNAYIQNKDKISLKITIDQNILSQENINFIGFSYDSGLENFKIEEIKIIPLTTEVTT